MPIQAIGLAKGPTGAEPVAPADLIRQLVEQVMTEKPTRLDVQPHSTKPQAEEIILDMDIDGARYLLVRLPKAERPRVQLSPREKEIVGMVAQGHSKQSNSGRAFHQHLDRLHTPAPHLRETWSRLARRYGRTTDGQCPAWPGAVIP